MNKKMNKYKNYKTLCEKLTDAKKRGYYYECLFIERLIIEDRLNSILKHLKVANKQYDNASIKEKVKLIMSQDNPNIQSGFNKEIRNDLIQWELKFNQYLKTISNKTFNESKLAAVQQEGDRIRKKIDLISKKFA